VRACVRYQLIFLGVCYAILSMCVCVALLLIYSVNPFCCRFLRKRYKSMSENPSQTIVCRVRNPAMRPACCTAAAAWANDAHHRSVQAIGSSSRSQLVQWRQDDSPRPSPVIDLNEACEPGYEMEMGDHHGYGEPLGIDKVRRYPMEGVTAAGPSEVRIPAFWDARSPAGRAGKRKISWQDKLALRV